MKKKIFILLFFSLLFIMGVMGFLWWNYYPPLPPIANYSPETLETVSPVSPNNTLKILSYNIHFGIGANWKEKKLDKQNYLIRLTKIAHILKHLNADIVLLQEVDFDSQRSQNIDQAVFLAEKANYPYIAKGPHQREKFHPHLYGMHGRINHGICILSRFPIIENQMRVFSFPRSMPFYLKWLYTAHGSQKTLIQVGEKQLTVFNVHLEPWAQKEREEEMKLITDWAETTKGPLIIGGDFNTTPPEAPEKKGYHMQDAPWFIDRKSWDFSNEKTIHIIRNAGFVDTISPENFIEEPRSLSTYPSDKPLEKLDYIFAKNSIKIIYAYVYQEADDASDHLPIAAVIKFD
ncbi:MAG: endonuclease/exonuclease/phosphatase family protein [Parachlamydiales bacterium]|nr:endonuclease/exonuclease/phosphatase family protein [Parachlamydiales bacterium]